MSDSNIPVMGHADGICHIFVDASADLHKAAEIINDSGVESQSETVWRQAEKYGVPRMVFVNKMEGTPLRVRLPPVRTLPRITDNAPQ